MYKRLRKSVAGTQQSLFIPFFTEQNNNLSNFIDWSIQKSQALIIFARGDPIQKLTKLHHTRPLYVGREPYNDQMLSRCVQAQLTNRKQEILSLPTDYRGK